MSRKNKRCSCGSNRKYKNCCGILKQRTFRVLLDPRNYHELDGLAINNKTLEINGLKDGVVVPLIGDSKIEWEYKRDSNKPKILNSVAVGSNSVFIQSNSHLFSYDDYFIVDTNTKKLHDDIVSIGGFAHGFAKVVNEDDAVFMYSLLGLLEYRNIMCKPENLVWMEVIKAVNYSGQYTGKNIAIVVDSDLGNLDSYNKRELPIYDDFYLPINFTLIYVSADSGAEFVLNKILRACDKKCSQLMGLLNETNDLEGLTEESDRAFTHFRQWRYDENLKM